MKVIEEMISPGAKRRDKDRHDLPGSHDSFPVELEALELDRGAIGVPDPQFDRGVRADCQAGRFEVAVAKLDFLNIVIRNGASSTSQNEAQSKGTGDQVAS